LELIKEDFLSKFINTNFIEDNHRLIFVNALRTSLPKEIIKFYSEKELESHISKVDLREDMVSVIKNINECPSEIRLIAISKIVFKLEIELSKE
jgi:hypothetical protein